MFACEPCGGGRHARAASVLRAASATTPCPFGGTSQMRSPHHSVEMGAG